MASKRIHRLSNVRADARLADCAGCGSDVPVRHRPSRNRWICKAGYRASQARPRDRGNRPAANRSYALRRKYGIELDAYDQLLAEQDSVCAICSKPESVRGRSLAVDHDHLTGRVRGLLCGSCNRAIGLMSDDADILARASHYLRTAN